MLEKLVDEKKKTSDLWQYNGVNPLEWHAIDYWMKKNPGPSVPRGNREKMDFSKIEERFKE